jgi:hypothetical protein
MTGAFSFHNSKLLLQHFSPRELAWRYWQGLLLLHNGRVPVVALDEHSVRLATRSTRRHHCKAAASLAQPVRRRR